MPMSPPVRTLPPEASVTLDPDAFWLDETTVVGGRPRRRIRLSGPGVEALARILAGAAEHPAEQTLARRLLSVGVLVPHPPPGPGASDDVTLVVPVRDRVASLGRTLASVRADCPELSVVVVDDGSLSAGAASIRDLCAAYGAELVRLDVSRGPGGARNAAAAHVATPFVALLDSDCVVSSGWLARLLGHFRDPAVAAVAPRIVPAAAPTAAVAPRIAPAAAPTAATAPTLRRWLADYLNARSPLDMGTAAGPVGTTCAIRYVPTAALVLRTELFREGFDPALRYGEDVDLIWRITDAGWEARYDPDVVVIHHEPTTLAAVLRRRFRYGTSAAPLAARHPGAVPPAILGADSGWVWAALLAGGSRAGAAVGVAALGRRTARLSQTGLPLPVAGAWAATGLGSEATGAARYLRGPGLPWTCLLARRRPGLAAAALLLGAGADWVRTGRRARLGPFICLSTLEDAAYGAGVLVGAVRLRAWEPVLPQVRGGATPARRRRRDESLV